MSLWIYLGQMIMCFLLNLVYTGTYYQMDDEAVCVHGAQRILQGEIPYRDFTSDITPGSYYLTLPALALFGFDPAIVRGLLAVLAALIGLPVQLIALRTLRGPWVFLPWLLWATCGLATHPILSYHWYSCLMITWGAYWLVRWQGEGQRYQALLVGLCGGLAFWVLQSAGLALALAALTIWLRFRPPGILWVGLGAFLTSLLLWIPFFPWRGQVWMENVAAIGHHLVTRKTGFQWNLGPQALANFYHEPGLYALSICWLIWLRYSLYYPFLIVGLATAERTRDRPSAVLGWVLVCWSLTFMSRQTTPYLGYPGSILCLLICSLLARLKGRHWPYLMASVAILSYLIQWYGLGSRFVYPVHSRSGLYWSERPQESLMAEQIHSWVERYTKPGSEVFAYPYFTSLYTTEYLKNPTREFLFIEGVFPIERLQACVQTLREKRVEFLIVQPLVPAAVAGVTSVTEPEYRKLQQTWLAELVKDYQLLESKGNSAIYRRLQNQN